MIKKREMAALKELRTLLSVSGLQILGSDGTPKLKVTMGQSPLRKIHVHYYINGSVDFLLMDARCPHVWLDEIEPEPEVRNDD